VEESILIWRGDEGREELEKGMRRDAWHSNEFLSRGSKRYNTF